MNVIYLTEESSKQKLERDLMTGAEPILIPCNDKMIVYFGTIGDKEEIHVVGIVSAEYVKNLMKKGAPLIILQKWETSKLMNEIYEKAMSLKLC